MLLKNSTDSFLATWAVIFTVLAYVLLFVVLKYYREWLE
jgi:hypothetical protein